ncbi:MAG: hypothetical protein HXX16_18295 [Bacteroidales bacterium]|nr:hypothetical protein [Bacteroidales bacterium]
MAVPYKEEEVKVKAKEKAVIETVNSAYSSRMNLAKTDQRKIIEALSDLAQNRYQFVIPIGFPAAGKSLFLSSLFHYADRDIAKKWNADPKTEDPFYYGNMSRNAMINFFDAKRAYAQTKSGTLDLIGMTLEPMNRNLPDLDLTFIDLAGEDIQRIKTDKGGALSKAIEGIFHALNQKNVEPIFCLITPYKPSDGDNAENDLHKDFLSYLKEYHADLYSRSKFIILVTQWDKKPETKNLTVEEYIQNKRPALYTAQFGKKAKIFYREYSIGRVIEAEEIDEKTGETRPSILINSIDTEYPAIFWNKLYLLATGRSLEPLGCWGKLFGGFR